MSSATQGEPGSEQTSPPQKRGPRWLTRLEDDDGTDFGDNDVHGIDGRVDPSGHNWSDGIELRIQLKARAEVEWRKGSCLYSLREDRYDKLQRNNRHLPLLVLVDVTNPKCVEWCRVLGQETSLSAVAYFSVIPFTKFADRKEKGIRLLRSDVLTPASLRSLLKLSNVRETYESLRNGGRPWESK